MTRGDLHLKLMLCWRYVKCVIVGEPSGCSHLEWGWFHCVVDPGEY